MSTRPRPVHEAANVHVVLSHRPNGVSQEDFDRWYESHLPEILRVPGFVSARLYRLDSEVAHPAQSLPYTHLAVYEFEGDADSAMSAIRSARAAADFVLPDWFEAFEREACLVSWNGSAMTDWLPRS